MTTHENVHEGCKVVGPYTSCVLVCRDCESWGHGISRIGAEAHKAAVGYLTEQPCKVASRSGE